MYIEGDTIGGTVGSAMSVESTVLQDHPSGEYFWGCELSKERQSVTWSIQEEDEDTDFMQHTLFIKHAVLGAQAVKDEVNIVQVQTKNYDNEEIKQPFISLTRGESSMCYLDVSFTDKFPVTFTLVDGSGPIYISAVQLVEFPDEGNQTMDEEGFTEEEDEETPEKPILKAKRKGGAQSGASKPKRSKMEASAEGASDEDSEEDDDDEEEEEDDDDDEEMDDDDEEDPTPEKKKPKKKTAKPKATAKKTEKPKAKKTLAKKAKK
ncbi:hypothetical protein SNE40_003520 [Patella caerulea]|uniref:Nucleoplasmin core domain-containing protein n=1 Tax=Patella caerulea TaxID=87958 RepID=A0AAN8KIB7_PATCE